MAVVSEDASEEASVRLSAAARVHLTAAPSEASSAAEKDLPMAGLSTRSTISASGRSGGVPCWMCGCFGVWTLARISSWSEQS